MSAAASDAQAELARACAESMYERDAAARSLGITIADVGPGFARAEMHVDPQMLNGHEIAHGGFVYTLADTAFAYACNSRNVSNVALQCSISYVGPARADDHLVATAVERSSKGRTGVYDVTVAAGGGEIAHFRGVCYRIDGPVIR